MIIKNSPWFKWFLLIPLVAAVVQCALLFPVNAKSPSKPDYVSASTLYRLCETGLKTKAKEVPYYTHGAANKAFCDGFVMATVEALNGKNTKSDLKFCVRERKNPLHFVRLFLRFMKDFPNSGDAPAINVVSKALTINEEYSCANDASGKELFYSTHAHTFGRICMGTHTPKEYGFCVGFIVGAGDAYYKRRANFSKKLTCFRNFHTNNEQIEQMGGYIQSYSFLSAGKVEVKTTNAIELVTRALEKYIPCKK